MTSRPDVRIAQISADPQVAAAISVDGSVSIYNSSDQQWQELTTIKPKLSRPGETLTDTDDSIETFLRYQDSYQFQGTRGQRIVVEIENYEFEEFQPEVSLVNVQTGGTSLPRYEELNTGHFIASMTLEESGIYEVLVTAPDLNSIEPNPSTVEIDRSYSILIENTIPINPPILLETGASLETNDPLIENPRFYPYDAAIPQQWPDVAIPQQWPIDMLGEDLQALWETEPGLEVNGFLPEMQFADFYFIDGKAGQELSIDMTSEDFEALVYVEQPDGKVIAISDNGLSASSNAFLTLELPMDGRYRVVATSSGDIVSGNYSIKINELKRVSPPLHQQPSAILSEEDLTEVPIRRGDVYHIKGKAGEELLINMESEEFDTRLTLENAEGRLLARSNRGQGSSQLRHTLLESGTYKVIATGLTDLDRGSYDLWANLGPTPAIDISPDGQSVAIASGGRVQLWDSQCRSQFTECRPKWTSSGEHQGQILSLAFSRDGKRIASGGDDRAVFVWNVENGSQLATAQPFREHNRGVVSVAFSENSQRIVSGAKDGILRISNLVGEPIGGAFNGHNGDITSLSFSHDNQRIVSTSEDGSVRVWSAQINRAFNGHGDVIFSVAFSPDGSSIASASVDGNVHIWDLTGRITGTLEHDGAVFGVAFSPDGKWIVSGGEDGVRLWTRDGKLNAGPFGEQSYITSVAFGPDSKFIASSSDFDGTIQLWDLAGNPVGEPFRSSESQNINEPPAPWGPAAPFDGVVSVAFSPDEQQQRIASASYDGTIRLWDLAGNQIGETFEGHQGAVYSIAFSPDGQYIASAGLEDRTVRLWDLAGNQIGQSFIGHDQGVEVVAFSPDKQQPRIASSSADGTVRLWDLRGNPVGPPFEGHATGAAGVAFSPDGRRLVSGGYDGTLRLRWATWKEWMQNSCNLLEAHPTLLNPAAYLEPAVTPDKDQIDFIDIAAQVSRDCNDQVWNQY